MTPERQACQIAKRHGLPPIVVPDIIRALRAAVAEEREACAVLIKDLRDDDLAAAAIRARGEAAEGGERN